MSFRIYWCTRWRWMRKWMKVDRPRAFQKRFSSLLIHGSLFTSLCCLSGSLFCTGLPFSLSLPLSFSSTHSSSQPDSINSLHHPQFVALWFSYFSSVPLSLDRFWKHVTLFGLRNTRRQQRRWRRVSSMR